MKLLRIDASAQTQGSHSKQAADHFQAQWTAQSKMHHVDKIDLATTQVPHITEKVIEAMYTREKSEQQHALLAQSNQFIAQIKSADALLISTPMYNFGVPSSLKAFFDSVARVGETFVYTDTGPKGLLENKKAYLIISSGGDYRAEPLNAMNHVDTYLKTILGFIGIQDVEYIHLPNMARGEEAVSLGMTEAKSEIQRIVAA